MKKPKAKEVPQKEPVVADKQCDESLKHLATLRSHCREEAESSEDKASTSEACQAVRRMGQALRCYQSSLLTPQRPPTGGHSPSLGLPGCGPQEQGRQLQQEQGGQLQQGQGPMPGQGAATAPQRDPSECPPLQPLPRPSPLSTPYVEIMDKLLSKIM